MQTIIEVIAIYCVMTILFSLAKRFLEWLDIKSNWFYIALIWLLCLFWLNCVMIAMEVVLYGHRVIVEKDIYTCAVVAGFMTWLVWKKE